ncbi:MAG: exodeoxyribonuclease VII large subunit [Devosia sp.]|jgi:exodeoxyribonuclease VII large subunit|uniref:exodeoxyribonuclease VII large subunit n=1 Tax=unclassified Devosia TaxID=196773 RepID=UPI0019F903B1|nr:MULTISPECIES: exodeoxyribonuclease VII large subunit [unclassified Devosia]MBF0677411.1 exodeoxyribonuclease VII large subunit [Devosia sp.]WEJ32535.1 exodeoxyribonuclease VII large subunit [Devosia sp. SD17-2]
MAEILSNAAEFTVSEIAQAVKRTVEDEFGHVRVRGEISGYRGQHSSGHAYFTLKDDAASIDAVIWKGNFGRLTFRPEEGLEVIATGRLTTFPRSSKYQIVIDNIEPAGAGALMALLEERRKKLLAEGLFARERKRPLPYLPRVIGVVTSPTGAVIRDILHRLADRFPSHVLVWPVRVQGEGCAPEVVNAIEGFNALLPGGAIPRPDLLIVARGGGSIEDLWGFNEEAVVRAVANSDIPVISAVGHETDTTLVDYASDMRAPTPTAAAEAAVPVRAELIAYVEDQGSRQRQAARRSLISLKDRLRAAGAGLPRPADLVATQRQSLDLAASELSGALRHFVQSRRLAYSQLASAVQPRLVRQRHAELGDKLRHLQHRSDAGLTKTIERARLTFDPRAARLAGSTEQSLERKRTALGRVAPRLSTQPLKAELRHAQGQLAPVAARLAKGSATIIPDRRHGLEQLGKLLASLGYRNVLARGYALVHDDNGALITGKAALQPGDQLKLTFADGDVAASVAGAPPAKRKAARPQADDGSQESLF